MAPNKDNTVEVAIALDKNSAAEYARQVGQSQSLMQSFVQSVDQMGVAAQKSGDRVTTAFQNAAKFAAYDEQALKQLREEYARTADAADNLGSTQKKSFDVSSLRSVGRAANQLGVPGADLIQKIGDVGEVAKGVEKFSASLDATVISLGAVEVSMGTLLAAAAPIAVVVGGVALAIKLIGDNAQEAANKEKAAYEIEKALLLEKEKDRRLARTKTSAQNQQDIDDLTKDINDTAEAVKQAYIKREETTKQYAALGNKFDPTERARLGAVGNQQDQDVLDLLKHQQELSNQYTDLTGTLGPAITAEENRTKALKAQVQAQSDLINGVIGFGQKLGKAAGDTWAQIQKDTEERVKRVADVQKKYNDSVATIEQNDYKSRADLAQKYADQQVSIAEHAVEASQAALDKLVQQYENLQTGLSRDLDKSARSANDQQLEDQIKAQRQERDDLQQHLESLKQIRDRDASRERDDLLNRNYRDLFALKESKAQDIANEGDKYVKQQQQRQQAAQDEQSDQQRARAIERRERLISYEQARADAQNAYKRELAQIADAKQKELQVAQTAYHRDLTALNNKTRDELRIKYNGYVTELQLASKTAAERVAIEQKVQNALLSQANNTLAVVQARADAQQVYSSTGSQNVTAGTPVIRRFASGGYAQAGVPIEVNEQGSSGRESFGSLRFPGHGIFTPFRSGNVSPNGGGGSKTVQATFNIYDATNPTRIQQMIMKELKGIAL